MKIIKKIPVLAMALLFCITLQASSTDAAKSANNFNKNIKDAKKSIQEDIKQAQKTSFTDEEVKKMSADNVKKLTQAQIQALTPAQLLIVLPNLITTETWCTDGSKFFPETMRANQFCESDKYNTKLIKSQISVITDNQILGMTKAQLLGIALPQFTILDKFEEKDATFQSATFRYALAHNS